MTKLIKDFKIKTQNPVLYLQAVTHSSYANENQNEGTYERIEFLGDAVLDLLVADFLYKKSIYNESEMSTIRIMAVREETLCRCAKLINLEKYILVGKKTTLTDKMLADVFEAFIGALYCDKQDNILIRIMNKTIFKLIDLNDFDDVTDHKTHLQELVQATSIKTLKYTGIQDKEKNIWTSIVWFDNIKMGVGSGLTKKKSEQNAAKEAIKKHNQ